MPQDPDPALTWYGNAVDKWDGDTLVVDSVGYKDSTWLDARDLQECVPSETAKYNQLSANPAAGAKP